MHWWQRHDDVIALRSGARKHVFPLAQFVDGRPTLGIRQVLSSIPNPVAVDDPPFTSSKRLCSHRNAARRLE
ncbi:antitoxin Xre/MbcA/ParS-like domain-containing protein [Mesorhizobium abyssinicae]|uniref:antitoxin Xre/MbcA/ParS-like domain-containing protein n=1 Tax=Mesorhizobium abyssinicae TaxID=1209958 RepID=UPI003CF8D0EE